MLVLLIGGFTKYTVKMGSGAMMYVSSFMRIVSSIQRFLEGHTYRHTGSKVIS
jgi:hypothetical protein